MICRWSHCGNYAHIAKSSQCNKLVTLYTHVKEVCRYLCTTHIWRKTQVDVLVPPCYTEEHKLSSNVPLLQTSMHSAKDIISGHCNKVEQLTTTLQQQEEECINIILNKSDIGNNGTKFTIKSNTSDTEHFVSQQNDCLSNGDNHVSINDNDRSCITVNECRNAHVSEEVYLEMLQSASIVAFAQRVAAVLREMPELNGILPVPLKLLQYCYSLALHTPARTRRSSSEIALEVSKQVRLLEIDLLSREEQATLDLHFATLHANAGDWQKAKNLVHCSDAIDHKTKEQFEEKLIRQEKCEKIVAQWERTPLSTSTDDVCYAIAHLTDWETAFHLVTQYELHSHEINHVRSTLLARADTSANMTWQDHYKYFSELPRNEQKYNIARTLIRRIPFSNENYIVVVSDVLQHTALTMSSATLARWLYNAQRRQNWCFAIALGCAARYYDVVLPWLQFFVSDKSSSSFSSKNVNNAYEQQRKKSLRMKRDQYKTRYIIPPELVNYEKTLVELEEAATLIKVLANKECSKSNNTGNPKVHESNNNSTSAAVVMENVNVFKQREANYTNVNNANEKISCKTGKEEIELAKPHTPTSSRVELNSDASFEVCLAHALHGDWRRVMHIPSAMSDRRLRALCNAMIALTSSHDENKNNSNNEHAHHNSLVNNSENIIECSNISSNSIANKQKVEVKFAKGKECFYFDSTFFSQVVFKHARQSAQERFLQSIPPSEYAHYTNDKALNLSLTPTQINQTKSSFLHATSSFSSNFPSALSRTNHTLQSATNNPAKHSNNFTSVNDKLQCLPTRVSNRRECAELFRFIHAELKETNSPHTKTSISDTTYFRLLAFCLADTGPTSLLAHTREEYTLPLYVLKTASLHQIRLDASMTVQLASSIPSPVLDKYVEVVGMLCDALLLLDRWHEVLPIYWRVYRKQHNAIIETGNNRNQNNNLTGVNDRSNNEYYKVNGKNYNQSLSSSHVVYSSLQHEQLLRLQEAVAKVAFYCHTNKKEYIKFVQHIKQMHYSTRISQVIFDLAEGNVRSVCEELERLECSLQTVNFSSVGIKHNKLHSEECTKDTALLTLSEKERRINLHKRQELLSAAFCLLHREDDLRTVLRSISQSHVAAVDLNAHGLQRLLRVLPTDIAVEALGEYASQGHTVHTHWIKLLMSKHDVQVGEVQLLSTLQPYACDVQQVKTAVCALRGHDAHTLFDNMYRFYCSSLQLTSSLSHLTWSSSHYSPLRTPSLRTLTLLLRSSVEDDIILSHALETYKTECTITTNASVIDNLSHASMRMLFDKLSECKELSFSFHSSRRVLHPALHYSSTLHAILLAGAMHHLLGKSLQIPIPASFTSRLLNCSCTANVDWTVSWFFFRALRHPTRSERQRIVQSLSSVEWTDKTDNVVSHALLNWREFLFYAPEQVVVWCNAHLGKFKWEVSLELSELFAAAELSSRTSAEKSNTKAAKSVINDNTECSENSISSVNSSSIKSTDKDVNNSDTYSKVNGKVNAEENDDAWMYSDAFVMVQELIRDWAHHECARAIAFLERIGHVYAKCEETNEQSENSQVVSTTIANVQNGLPESKTNSNNNSNINRKRTNQVNSKDAKAVECAQRVLKIIHDHQSNCFPPQDHNVLSENVTNSSVAPELTSLSEISAQTESESEDVSCESVHRTHYDEEK